MKPFSPLWSPSAVSIQSSQMTAFLNNCNASHSLHLYDYNDLYVWSIENISLFWKAVYDFCGIVHSVSYSIVVEDVPFDHIPKWFLGARLNYWYALIVNHNKSENMLRFRDSQLAIIETGEFGNVRVLTYSDLYMQVAKCAHALRSVGVVKGDRVVAYIPNTADAVPFC